MGDVRRKRSEFWKLESKTVRTEYVFDTVGDSPYLCTVVVINGLVSSYSGVYALDSEIVRKLEREGVEVPKNCRA